MIALFDPKRFQAYEIESSTGASRIACKFLLDHGSLLFRSRIADLF